MENTKYEMKADMLIPNDTVTISGGYNYWPGNPNPIPAITMSREQYLREVTC